MSELRIVLSQALPAYHPGEAVEGEVRWDFTETVAELSVTLSWTTEAKTGSEEPVVVERDDFAIEQPKGSRPFRFVLPESPWSFEGRLFSVKWAVGLEGFSNDARTEIVVSPTGQPIRPKD